MNKPLASLLRPEKLDDVCGQTHLLNKNAVFRKAIENGVYQNMIFYGPSGIGKTTVATIIAQMADKRLFKLNGTQASTADIKDIISQIDTLGSENGILLYLDEIQYLNKKQQQSLLEVLEDGSVTLIASTTENPYFAIFNAILSRSTIFEFKPLSIEDIKTGLTKGLIKMKAEKKVSDEVLEAIARGCGADLRKAFNALELLVAAAGNKKVTVEMAKQVSQRSSNRFDNHADEHYNLLSALQKSIRGSDANAALFYLARLLDADAMLSAIRRILIIACEDIGLAYPMAIPIVKSCCDIALQTGMPEAKIPLADAVVLLATSPKSNSAYVGYNRANMDLIEKGFSDVPDYLKDSNAIAQKSLKAKERYKYPHDYENHWVQQDYLPKELKGSVYYEFGDNKIEQTAKIYWDKIKRIR